MELRRKPTFGQRHFLWPAIGVLWIGLSASGLAMLAFYDSSAGPSEQPPLHWPADSKIVLGKREATLILFAHPHCPCTRASLGELEKIVARCQGAVTTRVVFLKPTGSDDSWDQTDLQETAAAIPSGQVVCDLDGVEARRFHATTSGQTLLYNTQGDLLFNGGITSARGHSGDNAGRTAIESYLTDRVATCHQTPVFGCPIAVRPEQK